MQASYTMPEHLLMIGGLTSIATQANHRFAIASALDTPNNELHILNYNDESNKLSLHEKHALPDGSVTCLSAAPLNETLLLCAFKHKCVLFELRKDLQTKQTLLNEDNVHSIVWEENENSKEQKVILGCENTVKVFDIQR